MKKFIVYGAILIVGLVAGYGYADQQSAEDFNRVVMNNTDLEKRNELCDNHVISLKNLQKNLEESVSLHEEKELNWKKLVKAKDDQIQILKNALSK